MSNNILSRLARTVFPQQETYPDPHEEHYNRKASGGSVSTNKSELRAEDVMNEIGAALKRSVRTHSDPATQTEEAAATESGVFLGILKDGIALSRDAGAPSGDLAFAETLLDRAGKSGVRSIDDIRSIHDHMMEKQGWLPAPLERHLMRTALTASQAASQARQPAAKSGPDNKKPSPGSSMRP